MLFEARPTRRSLLWNGLPYFVSFPWTYFLVYYSDVRPSQRRYAFEGLGVFLRTEPVTEGDNWLRVAAIPNSDNGWICLGNALGAGATFPTPEGLAGEAIARFFDSEFDHDRIYLPIQANRWEPETVAFNIQTLAMWREASRMFAPAVIPFDLLPLPFVELHEVLVLDWNDFSVERHHDRR